MKLYVGNLSFETAEAELRTNFEKFGEVSRVNIAMDKSSNTSRGFGFVDMPTQAHAEAAIAAMNGKELGGRTLVVNEARSRS